MNRRTVVLLIGGGVSLSSGCVGEPEADTTGSANESASQQGSGAAVQQSNHITITAVNGDDTRHSLTVGIDREAGTNGDSGELLRRRLGLDADESRTISLNIYQPDRYTVSAVVEGATEARSVSLDAYDVKLGVTVRIAINDGSPRLAVEKG